MTSRTAAPVAAPGRNPSRGALIEWLPVIAGVLVVGTPTFYSLANGIWQQDEYAHGPIILAAIAWLIWDRREVLLAAAEHAAPKTGYALLIFGLLVYVAGRSQEIGILEIGALIPILAGVLLAMRGWGALRALAFALLFVIYLIPLPGFFVDAITGPLKQHVSTIAEQILYSAGYPIARNGVVLNIGQYQLLVADACSGINSMFSLSAIGLLYLYLMRYKSWGHNALIVASLIPIAFCANIVRVIVLVLITYYYGDEAGQGFIHGFSGMILFVIALVVLLALDAILRQIFKSDRAPQHS
jgi:exosortase B